ncbi:sodium:proton antiporter [Oleispirillum naphthae]|uniref:sodium:proton antiporter n=1 Tax=Oleispirillum naphthae TaxID=2838853 RepID=UPI00308243F2
MALLIGGACLLDPFAASAAEQVASAAGGHAPHIDGSELGLLWAVPFCAMLLSIALFPLILPHFWHHNFGKASLFWALCFLVPAYFEFGFSTVLFEVLHSILLEYLPFIILLFSLFTVAGGVRLTGSLHGSPILNTGILAAGTCLASWMGTTGAAMLLIRPIIRANEHREHKVHIIVFFIFLVANIGGGLTPLGDPPLFLGFLKGVSFFWPTQHVLVPLLTTAAILLTLFFAIDTWFYRHEGHEAPEGEMEEKIGIEGKVNILLLGGIVAAVLMSGLWPHDYRFALSVYHVPLEIQNVARDVLLLVIAYLSWKLTSRESRKANAFNWFPIIEVGKLFFGIFMTIIPAIAILKAGTHGALSPVVHAVTDSAGEPINAMYFVLTGLLSSFLDNAPTYLVFFNTAGGDAHVLMGEVATLMAISCGAVFMGANTYVGNAPNFMVKAIAEERGVKMPSFFGYMAWSFGILGPVYALLIYLFFL